MKVSTSRRHVLIALGTLFLASACGGGGGPLPNLGLTDLGNLGYSSSNAYNISADGRVVAGSSRVDRRTSNIFRWTVAGMTNLSSLAGLGSMATVHGVSTDGAVVALTEISNTNHAYRWTESGGKLDLGALGSSGANAAGLSSDGTVVVGYSNTSDQVQHAFRWTQSGGMADLGTGGWHYSGATAASADGSVVVGTLGNNGNEVIMNAFRWTQKGGMLSLGALGGNYSRADSVSSDGSVVVGQTGTADGKSHAFRWTQSSGMVDLGTLNGDAWADYTTSWAEGVSADGKVVVGMVQNSSGQIVAFRWTQETGMQTINEWANLDSSTTFNNASATNRDGSIVVGTMNGAQAFLVRSGP